MTEKDGLLVWPACSVCVSLASHTTVFLLRLQFTWLTLHMTLFCFAFSCLGGLSECEKMGVLSKPRLILLICLAVVLLVLGNASASEFDPYRVLGVSRHAGQAEIRKAYKQLVKEWWVIMRTNRFVIVMLYVTTFAPHKCLECTLLYYRHPDKNKDPSAEDTFIKITKAYEVAVLVVPIYVLYPGTH